jgi:hypothetical protein
MDPWYLLSCSEKAIISHCHKPVESTYTVTCCGFIIDFNVFCLALPSDLYFSCFLPDIFCGIFISLMHATFHAYLSITQADKLVNVIYGMFYVNMKFIFGSLDGWEGSVWTFTISGGSYLGLRRNTVPYLEPCLYMCMSFWSASWFTYGHTYYRQEITSFCEAWCLLLCWYTPSTTPTSMAAIQIYGEVTAFTLWRLEILW